MQRYENTAKPPTSGTVRIVALGCAKNLVDTERVAGNFQRRGWRQVADGPADVVVVTTCGFIAASAQESVDTLLEEIQAKERGETRYLVAAGCLPDRYRNDLCREMDELDLVVGVTEMTRLPELVEENFAGRLKRWEFSSRSLNAPVEGPRILSGPPWRSYLKIADGCNQGCTFCIIPRIRGAQRSIPLNDLVEEARTLAASGVVELSLIAQDLTSYGTDLYGAKTLPRLLEALERVDGLRWIRLLYAHPAHFDDDMVRAMTENEKVVPYLDIPFQHISDRMLTAMNRHMDRAGHERLLDRLRSRVPDIAIRTTFITGFPGETAEDFEELYEFAREWHFDNVGVFPYSREENTPAFGMAGHVVEKVAEERMDRLMTLQRGISRDLLWAKRDRVISVLVEEELAPEPGDRYTHLGRALNQAPEIDGLTYLHVPDGAAVMTGDIVAARVETASDYDLFAALVEVDPA
ncbi:MAG: 30S ribosomal protein S12 methylthiotransferase RimO [Deltaproteobacteria bacterium]|nr:30S ribosomal protein S12 methylthiotransferase RimO [Deltaproteobacteria bacterium]